MQAFSCFVFVEAHLDMKVFQIVGVRKSGKTTTVECLIKKLKQRGYRVGTVKCINCPVFTIDADRHSNTARHAEAGADVVVAYGKREVDFIYPAPQDINQTLSILSVADLDYCIVEGGYEFDLPRIVCLKNEGEFSERCTERTFAVAGVMAETLKGRLDLPAFNAMSDEGLEALADLTESTVPELSLPVAALPRPQSCRNFCRGCAGHNKNK